MEVPAKEIIIGRKTFFIAPDTTLMPKSYLEDFFALGYECYYVEYDKREDLAKKVETIISLFQDVILFFNIDYMVPDLDWEELIRKLCKQYNKQANFGVFYSRRNSKEERTYLEQKYLYEIGLSCGCIQLEYSKAKNFEIIERSLFANQAQGRRKTIRALCSATCTYTCVYNGKKENGTLQDISLSHFSVIVPQDGMPVKLYEKIHDFRFNIQGLLFASDAVLMMERPTEKGRLCVFAFLTSTGTNGLEQRVKLLLIPTLYKLMAFSLNNLIEETYLGLDKKEEESN